MNATQKKYYRYLYEQKLPKAIRHDLSEITIHHVINSKTPVKKRYGKYPIQFHINHKGFSTDKVKQFVRWAIFTQDEKMLRIVFKRFYPYYLDMYKEVKPRGEPVKYFDKPLYRFKGWRNKLLKDLK